MVQHVNKHTFVILLTVSIVSLCIVNTNVSAIMIHYYELKYEYLGKNTYLLDNRDADIYKLIYRMWDINLLRIHIQGQKYLQSLGNELCSGKLKAVEKVFGSGYYAECITNSTTYALIIYTHNDNVYERLKSTESPYLFDNLGFDYVFIFKTLNDPNKVMDETFDIVNSTGEDLINRIYEVFGKDKIHTLSIGWSWYGGISMDIPDTLSQDDIYTLISIIREYIPEEYPVILVKVPDEPIIPLAGNSARVLDNPEDGKGLTSPILNYVIIFSILTALFAVYLPLVSHKKYS